MSLDIEETKLAPLPVEPKPAQDADPLEKSLLPALTGERAKELARMIRRQHFEALQDRESWEGRLAEWENQYYGRLPSKDFPWPGAANFHVPLTMIGVETYKPRLIESVLGNDPPIQVVPVDSTDATRRDRVELFINWQVRSELDITSVVAESAHLFMLPGTVVAKTTWHVDRRTRSYVREFPQGTGLEDILTSLFGDKLPTEIEHTGAYTWKGTLIQAARTGGPSDVEITLKFLDDGTIQVRVIQEDVVERPRPELIDPPDFIAPAKGGSNVQALPWCQHRLWMTEDDLRLKARQGRFNAAIVEELLTRAKVPGGDVSQQDATAYREGKAATEGVEDQGPSNVRKSQYEVLEDYRFWDVNEDGRAEHVVAWYAKDLPDKLLGWDLIDNVYAHGRRPFRVGRFFPVPFRFLGLSFAEVVRGIEDEADTIHNQRVDYGTIQNLPFFFYRASSQLAAFPNRLKPGEGVPVDNPQADINFPKWQGSPAFGQAEEALLLQYYERLTGLTDLSLGRQPNRVGATRTASGTSQLLSESGLRQKTALEAFQQFWIEVFEDILALDQEYLPPGKEFRVTGRMPEFIRLKDRNDIRGKFDLRLAAMSQTMNRAVAREDAQAVLQVLLNPALIQAGLVGLKGVQRALGDFLRAYAKDADAYLEIHAAPKSPEEELALLVSGDQIKPVAGEDIQAHLMAHQQQMQDPVIRSVLRPEGVQALQRHIAETMQLAQSMLLAQNLQQQGRGASSQSGNVSPQPGNAARGQTAPQPNQIGATTSLNPLGQGAPNGPQPGRSY